MKQMIHIDGLTIGNQLGHGGQGEVFQVEKNGKKYALKLYFPENSTDVQRKIITRLVQSGPPAPYAERFVWPLETVTTRDGKRFGYLMELIDTGRFISLGDIESRRMRHPGYGIMVEACRQLSECFRELHIAGYCYRDISRNNFLLSPQTGQVVICDNDNIIIDKEALGGMKGTTQYMAPEVMLGRAKPSTVTDQHSLAVLLFVLLCGGNPFNGELEDKIKILDGIATQYLYGTNPVFVFSPKDRSNRLPDKRGYRHVKKQWNILPTQLRDMFVRAFTAGLKNPALRVTDIEWQNAFTQMLGLRHVCTCRAENFWDPALKEQKPCWHQGCVVDYPSKLYVSGLSSAALLVRAGQSVTSMHLGEQSKTVIIGEMERHPSNPSQIVLRNKTMDTWQGILEKQLIDIPEGKAILLHPGIRIKTDRHEIIVYA